MLIGPDDSEIAAVKLARHWHGLRDEFQRHAALGRGLGQHRCLNGGVAETQEREAAPEMIEDRAAILHPEMRRSATGAAARNIAIGIIARRRCTVGKNNRGAVVTRTE